MPEWEHRLRNLYYPEYEAACRRSGEGETRPALDDLVKFYRFMDAFTRKLAEEMRPLVQEVKEEPDD